MALKKLALEEEEQQQQQQQQQQESAAVASSSRQGSGSGSSAQAGTLQQQQETQQSLSAACSRDQQGVQQAAAAADLDPSAAAASSAGPKERQLAALEARYVHSVYDAIAPHFAATRFAVWPRVRAFLEALPPGALLADVGCGNGKYFGVRRDVFVLGSDRSEGGGPCCV
jgi:hypothetical protein